MRALCSTEDNLFSGSYDGTVKVWDIQTLECLKTLAGHTGPVRTLVLSAGNIFSGSYDKTVSPLFSLRRLCFNLQVKWELNLCCAYSARFFSSFSLSQSCWFSQPICHAPIPKSQTVLDVALPDRVDCVCISIALSWIVHTICILLALWWLCDD